MSTEYTPPSFRSAEIDPALVSHALERLDERPSHVVVTGASGFVGRYIVSELLRRGHRVTGIDNLSKYGHIASDHDTDPSYRFVQADATDVDLLTGLLTDADHLIAGAALIGGISYFHKYPYDIIATNERIVAAACDAAIAARAAGSPLVKVTYLSSSMVYESTDRWPSVEGDQAVVPPPASAYGFQKLAMEYFAHAARQQYGLPFTILRLFNCVGVGEVSSLASTTTVSGSVRLALSHVVPDLIAKVLLGQDPLHILGDGRQVRCYTYGADLARGVVDSLFHPDAMNGDFNISNAETTSVLELAQMVWSRINGDRPLHIAHDDPFDHDVALRVPDVTKAAHTLGFVAHTPLVAVVDEVIAWMREALERGAIDANTSVS